MKIPKISEETEKIYETHLPAPNLINSIDYNTPITNFPENGLLYTFDGNLYNKEDINLYSCLDSKLNGIFLKRMGYRCIFEKFIMPLMTIPANQITYFPHNITHLAYTITVEPLIIPNLPLVKIVEVNDTDIGVLCEEEIPIGACTIRMVYTKLIANCTKIHNLIKNPLFKNPNFSTSWNRTGIGFYVPFQKEIIENYNMRILINTITENQILNSSSAGPYFLLSQYISAANWSPGDILFAMSRQGENLVVNNSLNTIWRQHLIRFSKSNGSEIIPVSIRFSGSRNTFDSLPTSFTYGQVPIDFSESEIVLSQYIGSLALPANSNIKGTQVAMSEPVFINLTRDFGAGNEPTVTWCRDNISFFTGSTYV